MQVLMQCFEHSFRIGKSCFVEFMRAPLWIFPVLPVENNVIQRDVALSIFLYDIDYLLLSPVSFTTLPESHCPGWSDRSFAGKLSVTPDNFICIISLYKIVADF